MNLNGQQISVLAITNDYGTAVYAYETKAECVRELASYCSEWWENEYGDIPHPTDPETLISGYFYGPEDEDGELHSVNHNESYVIESVTIGKSV